MFGDNSDNGGAVEIYLALPYMAIVVEKTADMNDDGQVTVSDFLEILSVYGETC